MRHDGNGNFHQSHQEVIKMKITTVGLDLAKYIFHVVGLNQANTIMSIISPLQYR
jgi:hypothetical protein